MLWLGSNYPLTFSIDVHLDIVSGVKNNACIIQLFFFCKSFNNTRKTINTNIFLCFRSMIYQVVVTKTLHVILDLL